jgi:predicted CXXCH cytochrome family protein
MLAVFVGLWGDVHAMEGLPAAAPGPQLDAAVPAAQVAYVGGPACVECHDAEARGWRGSHHDLAMQPAAPGAVVGDFDDAEFTAHGVTSRFYIRDGSYYVRTDGPDGRLREYKIGYTFGVTPLQQYLIAFPDGRLQALGIAWDSRAAAAGGQQWFHLYPDGRMTHDHVLHWTGPAQTWNAMCAACHSTDLRRNYDPAAHRYTTRWTDIDVGCEACHGPGARHVAWARRAAAPPRADRAPGPGGGTADPGRRASSGSEVPTTAATSDAVSGAAGVGRDDDRGLVVAFPKRSGATWIMDDATGIARRVPPRDDHVEVETCAPCHARRREIVDGAVPGVPFLAAYRPALLEERLYHADGQIDDEVYDYGSFVQSRMYRAGVTCGDCHEPHRGDLRARGNALCAGCHLPARFDTPAHHHHAAESPGAACVACHMPAKTYMRIDTRHDHGFRVPRPEVSARVGAPSVCAACHPERSPDWAAAAIGRWRGGASARPPHFGDAIAAGRAGAIGATQRLAALAADGAQPGIARATAIALLREQSGGVPAPPIARALTDADPLVRMAAAEAAEDIEPRARLAMLRPLLDDPLLAVRLPAALALASVPPALVPAADGIAIERGLGEYRRAEAVNADRPDAHVNLGLLALRRGDRAAARREYTEALRIGPYFIPAYVNLADLDRVEGREADAERVLRQALGVDPDNAAVHHALGLGLVRQGRSAEAIEALGRAARGAPDTPRYAYVYAVGLHGAGRTDEALAILRANHDRHTGHIETLQALMTISRDAGRLDEAVVWQRRAEDALR